MGAKKTLAEHRMDAHERVCTERYGNIDKQLVEIKQAIASQADSLNTKMDQYQTQNHERFNGISGRVYGLMVSSLGGLVVGLAVVVFYMMTHKGSL